jgi:hypothetical protein
MSPELLKKILAVKESGDGNAALELLTEIVVEYAAGEQPAPMGDPTAAAADPQPDPEAEAMNALARNVITLCGATTAGEAETRTKAVFAEHAEIATRAAKLEQSERRGLVADLVALGAETPATAWARNEVGEIGEGDARTPVKRLASEPIAELRSRVEALRAANPRAARRLTPPNEPPPVEGVKPLTKEERAFCAKNNLSEAEFRARKDSSVRRFGRK